MGCLATLDPIRPLGTCRDPPGGQGWVWGQWGHSWSLGLMTQPCALGLPISGKVQGGGWETECPVHGVTAWWRVGACLNADPGLSVCTTPGSGRGLTHLLCKRAGPDASGGTPAPATSPSKGRPRLTGDACPQTPTAMLSAGLPQLGGTCGQASPLGVLTTQDRPCPVYQSSEASHPSPRAAAAQRAH